MHIDENIELKNYTSYKVGGPAKYFVQPSTIDEVLEAVAIFNKEDIPLFILGKGSNILVSDKGYDGAVINLDNFDIIEVKGNSITANGGARLTKVVMNSVANSLSGMEDLAGIPGTIGGGIIMNAGAYGHTISDHLGSVVWYDFDSQEVNETAKKDLVFGYRYSTFKEEKTIILSATFNLNNGNTNELMERVKLIQDMRREKQPLNFPSCGSVFKRPKGNYAGALIEQSGFKGFSIGGAEVSEKHANFIINRGNATATDIYRTIKAVQDGVFKHTGVMLQREVILVGDFSN